MLTAALGPIIAAHYPPVKRYEIELLATAVGAGADPATVSDAERDLYLEHV